MAPPHVPSRHGLAVEQVNRIPRGGRERAWIAPAWDPAPPALPRSPGEQELPAAWGLLLALGFLRFMVSLLWLLTV